MSFLHGNNNHQEGIIMNAPWMNIITAGGKMVSGLMENEREKNHSAEMSLPESIEQARREWQDAQDYYNTVTDKDLIDHAAYMIQAAEKKYIYLMKRARAEGIVNSKYTTSEH
jgi:hypothetical protein